MPVLTNSIDAYQFLQIQGTPQLRQEDLEIIERAGVTGSGVRKLGQRGKPFEIITTNYEASYAAAFTKMLGYKSLVGDDPVEFVRNSVSEGTFLVLRVVEKDRFAIFNSLGGFAGGEECCHIVSWTLLG